jgi:NTE family protein
MIKNLVFKGGGVLGIAYAGAIEVLEENKILTQIQSVAGTSAGAITASLISLKYSAADILKVIQATDFKGFEDGWDPLRIATKYGLYKGNAFLTWMKQRITDKGLAATATFADFQKAGMLDLRVFASDLNTRSLKEFSVATTPDTIVAEAVRASMSIPLFFQAWTFSNSIPDNHVYVDGGTIYNYPITTFDTGGTPNTETLGFYLEDVSGAQPDSDLQYDQLFQYIKDLFQTLTDSQVIDFENDPDEEKRTVIIDDFGISATNFGLTDDQKQQLYNSGKTATANYLAKLQS